MAMIKGCSMSLFAASLFNLDVVRLNGQGQAVPKGFQANLPANQHPCAFAVRSGFVLGSLGFQEERQNKKGEAEDGE